MTTSFDSVFADYEQSSRLRDLFGVTLDAALPAEIEPFSFVPWRPFGRSPKRWACAPMSCWSTWGAGGAGQECGPRRPAARALSAWIARWLR
jgi:hypothetical protein